MKQIATVAPMLNLRVAAVYAQQKPVNMTFSGAGGPSTINLQYDGTNTGEKYYSGSGTLGRFTLRIVRAVRALPESSSTCSGPHFSSVAGAGVFRFQDGSLLKVNLTQAGDCIDLAVLEAHCTIAFQITGGTDRFKDASGILTLTETVAPVLADASNKFVLFASTGEFAGTISGSAIDEERQDEQR